jgi:DNA-binding beta-propeller fold protein YncE
MPKLRFAPHLLAAALVLAAAAEKDVRDLAREAPRAPLERVSMRILAPGAGWALGFPSSVAMGNDGLLYVLQRGEQADPVLVIDRDGRVVRSWGKGKFVIPHSIRVDPAGNIWTVDAASSRVYKFTPRGEQIMEIAVGGQPNIDSQFNGTTDIAFGPQGRIFISDGYGNARILEYTSSGKRVREWGTPGDGPGQFHLPHGIAVDDQGIIYVADRENGRLQRFDLDGKYLGEWRLGKVFSVTFRDGKLWIGTQARNEPNGAAGWLMNIDRRTGRVLGCVDSDHGQHTVNVTDRGELLAGARPDRVLWFRRR